nr:MAG TPA: TMEM108 family [Caudoviricetes sp.]
MFLLSSDAIFVTVCHKDNKRRTNSRNRSYWNNKTLRHSFMKITC